jgi:hypothetical protein
MGMLTKHIEYKSKNQYYKIIILRALVENFENIYYFTKYKEHNKAY